MRKNFASSNQTNMFVTKVSLNDIHGIIAIGANLDSPV